MMDLYQGSEYVLMKTRDGYWMLIINIPSEMFSNRFRRLRIMKISDLEFAPRATMKCQSWLELATSWKISLVHYNLMAACIYVFLKTATMLISMRCIACE
ncbi:auxin-responsive protein IAA16-like isoform X1 [Musa acuminata AAA Group]|uniref:auxin-responsive protein IAA16-like isoform X1 n=2 Tax=Musa acuminata AAA Group TaxID=214697 RepID=UPI0031DAA1B4